MRRRCALWFLACLLAAGVSVGCKSSGEGSAGGSGGAGGSAGGFEGEVGNLVSALRGADGVFEGEVTAIEFALSENNGTGGPDPDDDMTADPAVLPHTFVTYRIMEDFSGNAPGETVTMRFLGGVDPNTGPDYDIYELAQAPQFDIGDRDIVFLRSNEENACPLVDCANGRFRILQSPDDDRPYVFTELGQEVRLIEDSPTEGRLFIVGEHQIPEINTQTIAFPDGTTTSLEIESVDDPPEQDPAPPTAKHDFDPNPDGVLPKDEPGEAFGAPVAGARLEPDAFRELIRITIVNHPDFAWAPYANADPSAPFMIPSFEDVSGPANDDDPRVEPPERTAFEEAEASAYGEPDVEDGMFPVPGGGEPFRDENPVFYDPAVAADIAMRRQTITGITEMPNEEDEESAAEDQWTETTR